MLGSLQLEVSFSRFCLEYDHTAHCISVGKKNVADN